MSLTPEVIAAAQQAQRKWHYAPASGCLGQFADESGWGAHMPAGSNNPFGIKAGAGQPSVMAWTHEQLSNGKMIKIQAPFRKYASFAEAFDDHGRLLATSHWYKSARDVYDATRSAEAFVREMAKHYATAHNYADAVIGFMRKFNLAQYDVPSPRSALPTSTATASPPHAPYAAPPSLHPAIKIGGGAVIAGGIAASSGPDWMIWLGIAALVIGAGVALYFLLNHREQ